MSLTNLRIASHLKLEAACDMERVVEFRHVYLVVFTKEIKRRPTFISKKAIAPAKPKPVIRTKQITKALTSILSSAPIKTESTYCVLKTCDNGSSYLGDRVISVLVSETGTRRAPFWNSVFLKQNINKGDLLTYGFNHRMIKVNQESEVAHSIYL